MVDDRMGGTSWLRRIGGWTLAGLYGLWCLPAIPLALYLLIEGRTFGGRVDGGLLICLVLLPPLLYIRRRRLSKNTLVRALTGVLITAALTLAILAAGLALPRPVPAPKAKQPASYTSGIYGGRACSRFVGSSGKLTSWLSNLLPEVEHVALAGRVMQRMDAGPGGDRSRLLVQTLADMYQQMDGDETFEGANSSLALSYAAALGVGSPPRHYFLYVPRNRRPAPMPVLVFLHDLPGNLKAHLWVLSRLSEQTGCVVVAPTHTGPPSTWNDPRRVRAVLDALEDASRLVDVDPYRILLAGSGDGAAAAAAVFRQDPQRFCALALIAPREQDVGDLSAAKGRPVLLLCGQADDRIPPERARLWGLRLRTAGLDVQEMLLPSQDRFLFFTAPNETVAALADWVGRTNDPGQG